MVLGSVRLDLRPFIDEIQLNLNERERYYLMFLKCKMRFFLFAKDKQTYEEWVLAFTKTCILTNFSSQYDNIKILGNGKNSKVTQ